LDRKKAVAQFSHQAWNSEDGLPQNSVNAIVQTRDGYLWLGTQEGLVRFDGVRFTVFDKRNTEAITNSFVTALREDRQGTLWIGTRDGLIQYRDEQFVRREGLSNQIVRAIYEDRAGRLWVGTDGGGLNRLTDGQVTTFTTANGLSSNFILSICEDQQNNLWVGTDGGGLNRLKDGRWIVFTTQHGLSNNIVRSICEDRKGNLWIGTWGGGVNRFSIFDFRFSIPDSRAPQPPGTGPRPSASSQQITTYTTKEGLPSDLVYSIYEDREGSLWIGTDGGGLIRMAEDTFTFFTTKEGLSIDVVMSFWEDQEGSLWIGTGGGGLNRLREGKFTSFTTKNGLPHEMIWAILEDRQGNLWIGTDGGGLARFKDGAFTAYTTKDGLSSNIVWSLYEDKEGTLWIGTRGGGLNRFQGGRFTAYTTREGLSSNVVRSICEDREGNLWIGTDGGGLNRFKDGHFTVYTKADGLSHDVVRTLFADSRGRLWVGTNGGLTELKDGQFTVYTTDAGLSSNFVRSFYEDRDGCLWVGTFGGGLTRFKGGRLTSITTKAGLFDDVVFRIIDDGKGNFWMCSNRGVFHVNQKDLHDLADGKVTAITSVAYGKADGMNSSECNAGQPAGWRTRDGKLWFPTIRGVAMIDPENVTINTQPPPVIIEQAIIDDESVEPRRKALLPPGQQRFEFHYTALSFLAPEKVKFKFKLDGFDRNWVDAGARRIAYYTNLSPGEYRFRVMACNNDGVWNETGAAFEFYLEPHFYQTIWFYLLWGVLVGVAGWGLYLLRVRRLVRRTQELEIKVAERTAEVEQQKDKLAQANEELKALNQEKSEFLAIAAHDLRAPLVNLKGYAGELWSAMAAIQSVMNAAWPHLDETRQRELTLALQRDVPEALAFIDSSTNRMDQLVGAILRLSRLSRRELHPEPVNVTRLVETTLKTLAYQIEQRQAKVKVRPLPEVVADRNAMEIIMENILTNAVIYLDPARPGEIEITGTRDDSATAFHVRDNGRGIAHEDRHKVFQIFGRAGRQDNPGEGMGLAYVQTLIRRHGGRIWCESQLGVGTTFSFTIPHQPATGGDHD
jgi:ligand-binding sensor domain-containing protein/signal transduction histidine kinase